MGIAFRPLVLQQAAWKEKDQATDLVCKPTKTVTVSTCRQETVKNVSQDGSRTILAGALLSNLFAKPIKSTSKDIAFKNPTSVFKQILLVYVQNVLIAPTVSSMDNVSIKRAVKKISIWAPMVNASMQLQVVIISTLQPVYALLVQMVNRPSVDFAAQLVKPPLTSNVWTPIPTEKLLNQQVLLKFQFAWPGILLWLASASAAMVTSKLT